MRGTIAVACLLVACSSLSGLSGDDDGPAGGSDGGLDGNASSETGSPADGAGGDAPVVETAEQAAMTLASAYCARWVVCRPGQLTALFGGPQSCISDTSDFLRAELASPGAHVPSAAAVQACADAIGKESCRDLIDDNHPPECALKGDRAEGAGCISGGQCQSGFCANTDAKGCGVCRVPAKSGDDCSVAVCGPGLTCVGSRCVALAGLSEDCTSTQCSALYQCYQGSCIERANESAQCSSDVACNAFQGLGCRSDTSTCATMSVVQPGTGASCAPINNNGVICAAGYCKPNAPNAPVCTALARSGEACGTAPCATVYKCIAGQCALPNQSYCP